MSTGTMLRHAHAKNDLDMMTDAHQEPSQPLTYTDLPLMFCAAGNPHVADMGLARQYSPSLRIDMTPETGTYAYMAPENINHERYDERSDVFSWGVLLVEVLRQALPYAESYLTPLQVTQPPSNPIFSHVWHIVTLESAALKCF